MIVLITGQLHAVRNEQVVIERDGLGYEVLVCGYSIGELTAFLGKEITLHTMQYLEGSSAGGNLIPRLIGFLHREDRAFFEQFIKVKGMGARKALKALAEPIGMVAAAIESGDAKSLARLPGIGKRAAEQIIAELKGKVTPFALDQVERTEPAESTDGWSADQRDALQVMMALGERRNDAVQWLERAMQLHPGPHSADEWIKSAYRVRSGGGE